MDLASTMAALGLGPQNSGPGLRPGQGAMIPGMQPMATPPTGGGLQPPGPMLPPLPQMAASAPVQATPPPNPFAALTQPAPMMAQPQPAPPTVAQMDAITGPAMPITNGADATSVQRMQSVIRALSQGIGL